EAAVILACANPQTQCPEGDVILASQQDVDAFAINYPFCTEISGNLIIGNEMDETNITDLSALGNITSIGGSLSIFSTQVTSIEELGSLTSIGGDLQIWENWQLVSLFDHELTSFDGYLDIRNAGFLESLSGFANTTTL